MKSHRVGLFLLSTVLVVIESRSLFADDPARKSNAAEATSREVSGGLAGAGKFLGVDSRWSRLYTYESQVSAGTQVKSGMVISRVPRAAIEPMKYLLFEPDNFNGSGVLWIDGAGLAHLCTSDSKPDDIRPSPAVRKLLDGSYAVVSAELPAISKSAEGGLPMENSLLALRVRATLAAIAATLPHAFKLDIVGTGDAGPAVLLASAFLKELKPDEGKKIRYVIIDLHGANAESIVKPEHVLYLPGAIEFGGIPGIAALNGTQKLTIAGMKTTPAAEIQVLEKAYEISGNSNALKLVSEPLSDELLIDLLIRK
jgi:hypothetical protein